MAICLLNMRVKAVHVVEIHRSRPFLFLCRDTFHHAIDLIFKTLKSNITPELAHKIAKAFVRKTFGDDVQAVIATHVDKKHCHSHIIINSYSLSGQKFYANKDSLNRLREYSDGVCRAFGIEPSPNFKGTGRNMEYNEWEHMKNGTSWKEQIRQTIDELIGSVNSIDELLQALENRGYEVKHG